VHVPDSRKSTSENDGKLHHAVHRTLAALETGCFRAVTVGGLVNQRQQQIIEFQNAQIEALLKKLGKKRLLLDDNQRRLLSVKGYALGRKTLSELTTNVTPVTILRWHRELVAKKFTVPVKSVAQGGLASVRKSWTRLFDSPQSGDTRRTLR
jgi:hypothetical protein